MILTALGALMLAAAEQPTRAMRAAPDPAPQVRRMVIRNQLVIRVPIRPKRSEPQRFSIERGPRCFNSTRIAGARLAGPRSIDFLLADQSRIRVEMDDRCPSLDFYGGFYVQPDDDRLCARRDVIRTRMGGSCRIESFQRLRPMQGEDTDTP
ncbi:hypothetical protein [Sphingomicrobium astaxanthinifaciens]|uniref:hypothetical protein n=1 Tax=Sphingomicrobium astaxanthinifaciens TaxID=1227949 RepID=UPI001FCC3B51|nr:hypothetical protein [Sphingomicrobium astaxanthinifaciens]MCJ7420595.1 hypothetical protein [Sphingomicrobium astaxanthinifaciens]